MEQRIEKQTMSKQTAIYKLIVTMPENARRPGEKMVQYFTTSKTYREAAEQCDRMGIETDYSAYEPGIVRYTNSDAAIADIKMFAGI